jgi:hypothetical protein
MDLNDMVLISVDDHVVEPRDLYDGRMPASLKDRSPKVLRALANDVDTKPCAMGGVTRGEAGNRVTSSDVARMLDGSMSQLEWSGNDRYGK